MSSASYKWWELHEYTYDSELAEQMRMSVKMPLIILKPEYIIQTS